MSVAVAAVIRLRWEVWKSLVSMLRSYSGLAGFNDAVEIKMPSVEADRRDSVFFDSRHATLSLSFQPETGFGTWTLREREEKIVRGTLTKLGYPRLGTFEMVENGTLLMNQEFVELDMVAIDLVSKLVSFEHAVEGQG